MTQMTRLRMKELEKEWYDLQRSVKTLNRQGLTHIADELQEVTDIAWEKFRAAETAYEARR